MKLSLSDIRVIVVAGIAAAAWVAHAEISHQDAKTTKELVKILAERQIADDAKEEGGLEMLRKLCDAGKLEGEDCAEVGQ